MADGWQKIESAPKDGTEIMVWEPGAVPNIAVAQWLTADDFCGLIYTDEMLADVVPDGPRATHWQPLPQPPED